jgi:hypothetical protein
VKVRFHQAGRSISSQRNRDEGRPLAFLTFMLEKFFTAASAAILTVDKSN